MLVHTAHLTCRPDVIDAFKARLTLHARTTLAAEPGCRRFDVHQSKDDPTVFFLHEIYADQAALDVHRVAPHYLQFRADTADWVTARQWWFWHPPGQ